ncbi:hypothetical protein AMELA_G00235400 [Ameiurus melas]|uniref:Secreted protein n=1 Tax=Ameiurus melas TaxID=219545 RepID=A0A7J5ZY28_AMEME|nr:hypothetical protein AMELA_G00235400 [Ameiurus melas]
MILHRVVYVLLPVLACLSEARIHRLVLKNETRLLIHLNTFGYFAGGTLEVKLLSLQLHKEKEASFPMIGFSLTRSRVNGVLSYTNEDTDQCTLHSVRRTVSYRPRRSLIKSLRRKETPMEKNPVQTRSLPS